MATDDPTLSTVPGIWTGDDPPPAAFDWVCDQLAAAGFAPADAAVLAETWSWLRDRHVDWLAPPDPELAQAMAEFLANLVAATRWS